MKLEGWFDGSCEPRNPGGTARWGFVVYQNGNRYHEACGVIGTGAGMTNNVAEAVAAHELMKYFLDDADTDDEIIIRGDSEIVIFQVSHRRNKTPKGLYAPYVLAAKETAARLSLKVPSLRFEWIPRGMNHEADRMASEAFA